MDVSPAGLLNVAVQLQQTRTAQEIQLSVLKKAMDTQSSAAMALLQGVTGTDRAAAGEADAGARCGQRTLWARDAEAGLGAGGVSGGTCPEGVGDEAGTALAPVHDKVGGVVGGGVKYGPGLFRDLDAVEQEGSHGSSNSVMMARAVQIFSEKVFQLRVD
jgi:hypothetical protein